MGNTEDKNGGKNRIYKVGVRLLSDIQLKNILPTYENLFAKIEDCRRIAGNGVELNGHYQYNFMYDNVFSVLGKRGTGKTSVAFTLQKKISESREHSEYDVVLPLIMPEAIPENCTVLGWILAIVREEMERLEDEIRELEKKCKDDYRDRYRIYGENELEDSLVTRLDKINQMFFAGSYNPSNEKSYYRAIGYSVKQAEDYYRFAKEIALLWDAWIERIKKCYKLKNKEKDCGICPMIYFIFDDVDLAPEKINELLSVIIKYLSHPNIIVITTADERLFLEVIENQLDQKIGRLPGEWRDYLNHAHENGYNPWEQGDNKVKKDSEDLINQTAGMYLGKVLPPSTRYYLKLFHTAKQKENFYVEEGERLGEAVSEQINELINCIKGPGNSFMEPDNTLINFYLQFFGDTSRQISNVYISLKELVRSLKRMIGNGDEVQDSMDELYQICRYFLCVAINANHALAKIVENTDEFVDEVFLPEYNQWKLYINYSYINEFIDRQIEEDVVWKIEIILRLYALFAFVENILLLMEKAFSSGITKRKSIHAISFMTSYIQNIAFENRHIFRDDLHADIFFEHYGKLLDRLKNIVADENQSGMKFSIAYFYDFKNYGIGQNGKSNRRNKTNISLRELREIAQSNSKWFKELVGMLTMVYGNAYLFDRKDMAHCLTFRDKKYLVRYQKKICDELQENMNKCFNYVKLQTIWKEGKWKENLEKRYEVSDKENEGFYRLVKTVREDIIYMKTGKHEKTAEIDRPGIADNMEGERKYLMVDLSLILECVFKYLRLDDYIGNSENISNLIEKCPIDIARELVKNLESISDDRERTKRALAERISSVERVEYGWSNSGILFDSVYMSDVFERIFVVGGSRYEGLKKIGMEINAPEYTQNRYIPEEDRGKIALLDKMQYRKLISTLTGTLDKQEKSEGHYINEDEYALLNEVREQFMGLDLGVDLYNTEAMLRAVKLGVEVVIIGLLQEIYLFQTVHERYQNNNNLSSRNLEQVDGRNTYYYNFFEHIVKIVEDADTSRQNMDLQEKIRLAFIYERQEYVEQLIEGARVE